MSPNPPNPKLSPVLESAFVIEPDPKDVGELSVTPVNHATLPVPVPTLNVPADGLIKEPPAL